MTRLYHSIKEILIHTYGYADLESVFSVLYAISERAKYSDLGFTSTYAVTKLGTDPRENINTKNELKFASKLLLKYRNFVRRRCHIKNSAETKITDIYSDLFDK